MTVSTIDTAAVLRVVERFMGLGSASTFSLAEARKRAKDARQKIVDGIDPIEHRRSERATRAATAATVLVTLLRALS